MQSTVPKSSAEMFAPGGTESGTCCVECFGLGDSALSRFEPRRQKYRSVNRPQSSRVQSVPPIFKTKGLQKLSVPAKGCGFATACLPLAMSASVERAKSLSLKVLSYDC